MKLYKQPFHQKIYHINKSYKSSDTEKYVYELKDNRYIETVFIKRRDMDCLRKYASWLFCWLYFVSPDAMVSFVI